MISFLIYANFKTRTILVKHEKIINDFLIYANFKTKTILVKHEKIISELLA